MQLRIPRKFTDPTKMTPYVDFVPVAAAPSRLWDKCQDTHLIRRDGTERGGSGRWRSWGGMLTRPPTAISRSSSDMGRISISPDITLADSIRYP